MTHMASHLSGPLLLAGSEKAAAAWARNYAAGRFEKWAAEQIRKHHPEWSTLAPLQKRAVVEHLTNAWGAVQPHLARVWQGARGLGEHAAETGRDAYKAYRQGMGHASEWAGRKGTEWTKSLGNKLQEAGLARGALDDLAPPGGLGNRLHQAGGWLGRNAENVGGFAEGVTPWVPPAVVGLGVGQALRSHQNSGEPKTAGVVGTGLTLAGQLAKLPFQRPRTALALGGMAAAGKLGYEGGKAYVANNQPRPTHPSGAELKLASWTQRVLRRGPDALSKRAAALALS